MDIDISMLECGVCLGLICEPVTISCGHSYCRNCLIASLRRTAKKCPQCRAVCHSSEDQPENVMIAQIARSCFPKRYAERLLEEQSSRLSLRQVHPIFFYNLPMFPGGKLNLHLFEPRYRLMMQRIIQGSRRFMYAPNYNSYQVSNGDVAVMAEIRECEFLADGRAVLEAELRGRYTIVSHFIEEGTQGLHYCQVQELHDVEPTEEEVHQLDALKRSVTEKAEQVISPIKHQVMNTHGPIPSTAEALGLWLASVLPLPIPEKQAMLSSNNTLERLKIVGAKLEGMAATSVAVEGDDEESS